MPKYLGLQYSQADGASLVSFIAPAEEIRQWGGIPHKTTDFLGGFQRPLGDRYKHIIDFFDEQKNQSPTAIVVAFRPGAVKIAPIQQPPELVTSSRARLVMLDVPDPAALDSASTPALAEKVLRDLKARIPRQAPESGPAEESESNAVGADPTDVSVPPPDDAENEDDEWGVDVGKSALADFASRIENPTTLAALKDKIAEQILEAGRCSSPTDAQVEAEAEIRDVLTSLLRPALIVDGQHRVWGASECEREIPFAVVGIVDADWKEQVFQFVIINRQARAISGEFLASIVNSSLTNDEISYLEDRLEAAGLKTYETKMLRLMNDDPDSPFFGMVSKGLDETPANKITFKASMAIVRRWNALLPRRDPAYKTLFQPALPGASAKEKSKAWERVWKDYMFAFWHGVRNLYKEEQLWQPKMQLMFRATMEVLQDNFLEKKAAAGGIIYDNTVKLREDVEDFYRSVPAGFFHTEWKRKELLTKDGREVLKDAINKMRVPNTKLKSLVGKHPLFTGAAK